ncbi:MAG: L,D-transpeptidase [Bacteroidales bacterium]|nr:L,D-transpeptidase [Bacteroidales bacterium]
MNLKTINLELIKTIVLNGSKLYLKPFINNSSKQLKAIIEGFLPVLRKIIIASVIFLVIVAFPILIQKITISVKLKNQNSFKTKPDQILAVKKNLEKDITRLNRKLQAKVPKSYYIIINSASNEFSLYKGTRLIRKDKCSTGSYILLKNGKDQQWMFKTPKGEFWINGKTTSPVWKKPDWAFVEEGLPVPPPNHYTRFEYGVLGDYALSFGKGYLIHGTLYQRFLGLPVTHGCIRLNDENLKLVYNSLIIGSKIYIY